MQSGYTRLANASDLREIASVTQLSWTTAFDSILPPDVISKGTLDHFEDLWRPILDNYPCEKSVIVQRDETTIACGAHGPYRMGHNPKLKRVDDPRMGELYRCYVSPHHQGGRIGVLLFKTLMESLIKDGYETAVAWAYRENKPANRFFSHLGGEIIGEGKGLTMGEFEFDEVCYEFKLADSLRKIPI